MFANGVWRFWAHMVGMARGILCDGGKPKGGYLGSCAGMNKMVINHLEKLFVTSDASTIVSELEVQHPAAKLLVMAAKSQESEIGDGTNLVWTYERSRPLRMRGFT